jgi:hypothetical protein
MGGGKFHRPAHYRSMIPNGLGGVLHRLFEKEYPKFDYKFTTMEIYAAHLTRILSEKFLEPARQHAYAQELMDTGPTSIEGRKQTRIFRRGGTATGQGRGHDRQGFDRYGGTGRSHGTDRTDRVPGPAAQHRQHWAPSTMQTVMLDEYGKPLSDRVWGGNDYPDTNEEYPDGYGDRSDGYGDRSEDPGPDRHC